MSDIEDFNVEAARSGVGDEDDAQNAAAKQLQRLTPWQWPLVFGPFILLIAFAQLPIANSVPTGFFVGLLCAAVLWAVLFKGYLLYLNYQK